MSNILLLSHISIFYINILSQEFTIWKLFLLVTFSLRKGKQNEAVHNILRRDRRAGACAQRAAGAGSHQRGGNLIG